MAATLLQALLNIQAKAPKVQRDGLNPFTESRYMTLDSVIGVVLPMLNEEHLLWQARPSIDGEGRPVLEYSLTHVPTKESISDRMHLMLKQGSPQDQGSAITYARRYALVCVLNLVTDRDDDGHAATEAARAASLPPARSGRPEAQAALTPDQQNGLRGAVAELAGELQRDFPADWEKTVAWAAQRQIDLGAAPADKLRAVERALRTKLERCKAEQAKSKGSATENAAA